METYVGVSINQPHQINLYPIIIISLILIMIITAGIGAFAKHKNEKVNYIFPFFPLAFPIMLYWLITDWNGQN